MPLTQKETDLLKDMKSQEKLCIEKYAKYANEAVDAELKNLLNQIGQVESQHLNTLNQIGGVPVNATAAPVSVTGQSDCNCSKQASKDSDAFICSDALSTEKHASSVYDTCIFEFKDTQTRTTLNKIQKEEQDHGEKLYNYMSSHGMY
ncbi:MAG: spore coat protein [Eubacteriales bacterium]|nr:spore coat protein [Eubacteriales bacterium]